MAHHSHDGSDPICRGLLQFFVIVFLSILLLNSIDLTDSPMSLTYFPSVTRENEPFMVNALVRNPDLDSHRYTVNLFIDGALASSTEMLVDAISMQTSTLTIPSPKLGSAVRIHAEILDEETGIRYSESLLVPQSPPRYG